MVSKKCNIYVALFERLESLDMMNKAKTKINSTQNNFPKHPKYMQVLTSTAGGGVCKIVGRANLLLISLKLSAKKNTHPNLRWGIKVDSI